MGDPRSLLRRLLAKRTKSCSTPWCDSRATVTLTLIDPKGSRIDGREYCQQCADETGGMLIPAYLDGRPAFEVLPL